ncbi:MAG: hypothetical protein K2Z81_01715, partial [Cyanobacteria bacterium]|nr:hypothetical protein [Cyanobacteriota bacterium]
MRKTDQQVKLIACSMLSFLLAGLPVSAVEAQSLDFTVGEKVAFHRVYPNLDPFQSINEVQESEQVDTYHGVKVSDPFRWLENFQSNEVVNWVDGRDKYAKSRLRLPFVHGIYHRLEKYAIESRELPYKVSCRYFFSASDGYTPRLYSLTRINARPVLVFDSAKV